jgi:chaperonin GroES
MKLIPIHDHALIERQKPEARTKGGILIPTESQKESKIGKILALGPDVKDPDIEVGQEVVFSDYHTTQAEQDSDLFIVDEEDIEAVLCQT